MGDVVAFLTTLYSLLVDRNKAADYNGPLVMSIFKVPIPLTVTQDTLANRIGSFLQDALR
jgi:hypothetical protein